MRWLFKNLYLLSILGFSFLPFIFWFASSQLVHTHDGLVHLPRLFEYYDGLVQGDFPVRWAGGINYGYGLPLFNFIYHTPYIIGSFFLALGFGVVNAFKLTLLLSFLLSGVCMFIFTRKFFLDEKKAFIVTLLYQFAPFHLIDLLIRGSFGEVFTYAFLPLTLYFLVSFFSSKRISYLVFTAISTSLLVISHNSISLLFFATCVVFCMFFGSSLKLKVYGLAGLLGGIVLSAYYWLPAVLEHKYTLGDVYMRDLYAKHFFDIWKIFIPNLNDLPFLQIDNLSIQIGLFQIIALILGVIWYVKTKKKENINLRIFIFSSLIILGSLVFMHSVTKPIWESISLLRQFQFPWRFMAVVTFAASLYGVFITGYQKKNVYIWILAVLIVISSFIYWLPKEGYDEIDEEYYDNFPLTSTYYGETDVIWTAGAAKGYPKSLLEIVDGEGKITNIKKQNSKHAFEINAQTPVTIVSNTVYFPGWRVYIMSPKQTKELPVQFQDPNYRGLVQFPVPEGNHLIKVVFEESKLRLVADALSLSGIFTLLAMLLFLKSKKI